MAADVEERRYVIATDMGGTFTDLVIESQADRAVAIHKSPTTLDEPIRGILDAVDLAAEREGVSRRDLLANTVRFIHGTTRALNAVLTGTTARTAFFTTQGHPDILLFREGGRLDPFNFAPRYPEPLIPRSLTFEIDERVGAEGDVLRPLDERHAVEQIERACEMGVESVAVSLLWSIANPAHELRLAQLLADHAPHLTYTLSHQLNPIVREYRRACSTALDAALKPVMSDYLGDLQRRLTEEGLTGRLLIVTSGGGVLDAEHVSRAPVHTIGSGPAMAPVAGRDYVARISGDRTVLVADTGGTSYDVGVVRDGDVSMTRETWLGRPYMSHMTGLPSVDIKSVGAGGGSIASVDEAGLLSVGPRSAGSSPGPVCYGAGGTEPTVTDAAVVLGYIDPEYFLGGRMKLDAEAAHEAIRRDIAEPLGFTTLEAAAAIMRLITEHMASAIEDTTVSQGVDPTEAVLVAGGGAGGFNAIDIGERLQCKAVVIPDVGSVLSAAGASMSDLATDFTAALATTTAGFDFARVATTVGRLVDSAHEFAASAATGGEVSIRLFADTRYPNQAWELQLPLRRTAVTSDSDVDDIASDFHALHEKLFAFADRDSPVEILGWRVRVSCSTREHPLGQVSAEATGARPARTRSAYFAGPDPVQAQIWSYDDIAPGATIEGPAIVETPVTVVVVPPEARATRAPAGALVLTSSRIGATK